MKLIEGKKARYLLEKENIKDYEYNNKDYFLKKDTNNNFVINLYYIKTKNDIVKVTSFSKETAEKISDKELEEYLKKVGLLKEKIIKEKIFKDED